MRPFTANLTAPRPHRWWHRSSPRTGGWLRTSPAPRRHRWLLSHPCYFPPSSCSPQSVFFPNPTNLFSNSSLRQMYISPLTAPIPITSPSIPLTVFGSRLQDCGRTVVPQTLQVVPHKGSAPFFVKKARRRNSI